MIFSNKIAAYIYCCVLVGIAFFVQGCEKSTDQLLTERTIDLFNYLAVSAELAIYETGKFPPDELNSFVQWLKAAGIKNDHMSSIDFANNTIKDAWGKPIIILYEKGQYAGLGSSGPDGKWQGNKGDDIFMPRRLDLNPS